MQTKTKQKSTISKSTKLKTINIIIFIGIIALSSINIFFSGKISKTISSKKTQSVTQQANTESIQAQQLFFQSNPEISSTISEVLPNQNTIINVIDDILQIQTDIGIVPSFDFSSIVPTKDANSSYVTFNIKTNTTTLKAISFLRSFEKLPYLTKITSINMKTPQGIGGPIEFSLSGRIYVQDPF